MGTCYSFVSTEKIKDLGAFSRKLEHNFRIGGRVPNADPMKSYLNEELIKLEPGSDYIKEYNKRVLDSVEAAQYLGISYWLIRKLVREKKIPYYKIESKTLFTKEILDKYIQDSLEEPKKKVKYSFDNF